MRADSPGVWVEVRMRAPIVVEVAIGVAPIMWLHIRAGTPKMSVYILIRVCFPDREHRNHCKSGGHNGFLQHDSLLFQGFIGDC